MRPRVTLTAGARYRTKDGRVGVARGRYDVDVFDFGRPRPQRYVVLEFGDGHREPFDAATLRRVDDPGDG